jgi:Resolvase, N terminal domain
VAGPRRTGCCEQMRCLAVHVHGPSADPPVDIGDRLGRSLQDLVAFLSELHALGIDLFLHQQGLDTTTPAGKAMFQMMGVFAEFERAMIQERVRAGLARARSEGKRLGRPPIPAKMEAAIRAALPSRDALGCARLQRALELILARCNESAALSRPQASSRNAEAAVAQRRAVTAAARPPGCRELGVPIGMGRFDHRCFCYGHGNQMGPPEILEEIP